MNAPEYRRFTAGRARRRGMILVLVLVVIAMLALGGLALSQWMVAERMAALVAGRQVQARALAESGLERARQFAGRPPALQDEAGGWYDNVGRFRALVLDGPLPIDRGRFAILAPRIEDLAVTGTRYGLEDESARINLDALLDFDDKPGAARKILLGLPGMTESIADAILDWLDADDELREYGAETAYYASLSPGYAPRNGPPGSIDELLLVRGVTRQLLYGVAAGAGEPAAADRLGGEALPTVDNSDGAMTRGWAAYLTLHSAEGNLRPDGTPKIDLNQSDLEKLYTELNKAFGPQWAAYIVAYRQYGPSGPRGDRTTAVADPSAKPDLGKEASVTLTTVLDLVGGATRVRHQRTGRTVALASPFSDDRAAMKGYLPKLLDNASLSAAPMISGRINVNQAPRVVLRCIPGLSAEMVEQIIAKRVPDPSQGDPGRRHATWLYTEEVVKDLAAMKALMPYVTGGGGVFRARSIGFFDGGGPAVELEAVIDATKRPPCVLSWKYAPTPRPRMEQP